MQIFQLAGSGQGLLPGPFSCHQCAQESHHHPFWAIGVPLHAFQPEECLSVLPVTEVDCTFANQPSVSVYLDDNLAATTTAEEHLQVLWQVFQLLKDNSLELNLEKCEFLQESISFLGHKVHEGGVGPLTAHVYAITYMPPLSTPKELQRFLGIINFYSRFLLVAARTLRPLTEALKGNPKVLSWTTEMQAAATAIRAAAVLLCHPLPTVQLSLANYTSDSLIGSVLQQQEAGA